MELSAKCLGSNQNTTKKDYREYKENIRAVKIEMGLFAPSLPKIKTKSL